MKCAYRIGGAYCRPPLVHKRVEAALDLDRRAHADVALERFAVVPDRLDDAIGPIVREAQALAEIALDAEQAADVGLGRFEHLVDIGLRDAELLRGDHREMRPLHELEPFDVVGPHRGAERLLGDDLRQHDVVVGIGELQALGVEAGGVGGVGVAAAAVVGFHRLVVGREHDRLELDVMRAEEVGEVQLRRRALLHADAGAVELQRAVDAELLASR